MNLAVNARDAMPDGGVLSIETSTFEVDEGYAQDHAMRTGRYARMTVSDTGTGMEPAVAARAFEPFFTTKRKGEGSGLGLATVYGIVAQAGGDVVIYTEPGLGTTVRVHLPATDEDAAASAAPSDRPHTVTGETILLVEDEDMVREPTRRILAANGYVVLAAAGAEEAVRLADEYDGEISLLLTDVVMPGRSGKELAHHLQLRRPLMQVLFMSGYSQDVIAHRGVLEEGVKLVEKPFAAAALLAAVRDVLVPG